jgi:hypothetical protein
MATGYHCNGVSQIKVGTGASGALELLGHAVNGVHIDPQYIKRPVYTDASGGDDGIPATHRKVGEVHIISCDLVVYDEAVLSKVREGTEGLLAAVAEGVMTKAGAIFDNTAVGGSGVGGYHRLLILSPDDSTPRNYLTAHLIRAPVRRRTAEMIWGLQWEAIPYLGTGTTLAGVTLFNSTTT